MIDHLLLRRAIPSDAPDLSEKYRVSRSIHAPWLSPPDEMNEYIQVNDNFMLLVDRRSEEIAGFFNLSGIIRGRLQQAFLGYAVFSPYEKRGYMAAGMKKLLDYAFNDLDLHRIEANIQPENERSKLFIEKSGFVQEGFSMNYLFLDNAWRDHERWAITRELWEMF